MRSILLLCALVACTSDETAFDASSPPDGSPVDAAPPTLDAGLDSGFCDGSTPEDAAGAPDQGADGGESDAQLIDATTPSDAGGLPPVITSFSARPSLLPPGGGRVRLSWSVAGADQLTIEPEVGVVVGSEVDVDISEATLFTLTAQNTWGTATATTGVETGALFVDPVHGADTNPGTLEAPFATIHAAAQLAGNGDTIYCLDGVHEIGFVHLADGVRLHAVNVGVPEIKLRPLSNGALIFDGSGEVYGIHVASQGAFGFFQASSGVLSIRETHYTASAGNYALVAAANTAHVQMFAPSDGEWCLGECRTPFAAASENATIEIFGGRIAGFGSPGTLFHTNHSARMTLEDVVIEGGTASPVVALANTGITTNTSTVVLIRTTIRNATLPGNAAVFLGFGSGVLEISDSSIVDNAGIGLDINAGADYSQRRPRVSIQRSHFDRNRTGIRAYLYSRADVFLTSTSVDENSADGIECTYTAEGCSFEITGGSIRANGEAGITLRNDYNKRGRIIARSVEVSGNLGAGLYLAGLAGSSFDFGSDVSPGMSTILGSSGAPGMTVSLNAPEVVWAVGNTWVPNVQGADSNGTYIPTSGTYTEVSGPVTTGENYRLVAGSRLRL